MLRIVGFSAFVLAIVIFVVMWFRGGGRRFPWFEFYSRGRKEGFSFREIGFLKRIALQNKLEKPQSIYWSTRQLDRCLRPAIEKINADEDMAPGYKKLIINKLLELRKKAEFNLPKYQKRIHNTGAVLPRQKLLVRDKDYGSFLSWVIENNRKYLVCSRPSGQRASQNLEWTGRKINVYFWRQDDAGYSFDTKVFEQIAHEEYPMIYLQHSSKLERVQKRGSIRVETKINGKFFPVFRQEVDGRAKAAVSKQGHSCRIVDLSETGCAFLAGRGMKKNDRFKIDFYLTDEKHIVALCVVVNVSKVKDERVRRYHVQFTKVGTESKNNILLYTYNIYGEREEEEEKPRPKVAVGAGSFQKNPA